MPRRRSSVPAYRLHKPSGQGVVTVRTADGGRKDIYLGPYNSADSLTEYRRVLATVAAGEEARPAAPPPSGVTVAELLLAFLKHAREIYQTPAGKPTGSFHSVGRAIRPVRELFAHVPAAEFGPKDLTVVRAGMVEKGISRKVVNARVQTIRKVFRWGVAEDLVPVAVYQKLQAVEGLRVGRTAAPDRAPVVPADPAHVEAAVPFMPAHVAGIVRLQRMTGARCGELCVLRPCDIDRTDPAAWVFTPAGHKGTWKGKTRRIFFGKRCQDVLAPFLLRVGDPTAYVFSPARAEAERAAERSAKRKTPRWASHMRRNETKRKKRVHPLQDQYTTGTVRQAVERACRRAKVPEFTPHQLRHLAATEIRRELGIDVARAVLGHTMTSMSEHYSKEVDRGLALKAVAKFA